MMTQLITHGGLLARSVALLGRCATSPVKPLLAGRSKNNVKWVIIRCGW